VQGGGGGYSVHWQLAGRTTCSAGHLRAGARWWGQVPIEHGGGNSAVQGVAGVRSGDHCSLLLNRPHVTPNKTPTGTAAVEPAWYVKTWCIAIPNGLNTSEAHRRNAQSTKCTNGKAHQA
jgi:hypothetical protein